MAIKTEMLRIFEQLPKHTQEEAVKYIKKLADNHKNSSKNSLNELAEKQNIKPIENMEDMACPAFEDEPIDELLEMVNNSRKKESNRNIPN